jgi:hypothetical protein
MLKVSLALTAIGMLAFGLMFTPLIGPPGICATTPQVFAVLIGIVSAPIGFLLLVVLAIRQITRRVRPPKASPTHIT